MSPYSFLNNNPLYFIDPTGMASDGWIKRDVNGQTSMSYDANVNTVEEAVAAGYKNVVSVGATGSVAAKDGSYSYSLNADGTVTNTSNGSSVPMQTNRAYGNMLYGGAMETRHGTKIYSNATTGPRELGSGAITPMELSSPFFSWGFVAKGLSALWGAAFGTTTKVATTTTAVAHYFPPNGGAMGSWTETTLSIGTKIDRYGSSAGSYFSPAGTPLPMRALPPGNTGVLSTYQVLKPFNVQSSSIAPAFNQMGAGIQYQSPFLNASQLVQGGYLMPIK